jgi:hypothetical protein
MVLIYSLEDDSEGDVEIDYFYNEEERFEAEEAEREADNVSVPESQDGSIDTEDDTMQGNTEDDTWWSWWMEPTADDESKKADDDEMGRGHRADGRESNAVHTPEEARRSRCTMFTKDGSRCGKTFSRSYDLTRHQESVHRGDGTRMKCAGCHSKRTYTRNDALMRHQRRCVGGVTRAKRKMKNSRDTEGRRRRVRTKENRRKK